MEQVGRGFPSRPPEGLKKLAKSAPRSLQLEPNTGEAFHTAHTRQIFRSITRELSYFPDRFAAEWIRQHILHRFRAHKQKVHDHRQDAAYEERLQSTRRKARQVATQLQKANEGDRKMMIKALNMAYGRVGARRRDLLNPLLPVPQAAEDSAKAPVGGPSSLPAGPREYLADSLPDPTALEQKVPLPSHDPTQAVKDVNDSKQPKESRASVKDQTRRFIDSLPLPLHALILSQIASSPPEQTRRNPKRLSIPIAELNAWHRPMPQLRVRNQIQAWYAKTLDSLLPPLPDEEWHRLHALASGKVKFEGMKARRRKLAAEPTALEMVVLNGRVPEGFLEKRWKREITPRYMGSVWREVFEQCPRLDFESATGKWSAVWGHHALAVRPVATTEAPSSEAEKSEKTSLNTSAASDY
ncbi:hypothetical protein B0A48_17533 [Cryoendolithus antarcticus]|uniref:LYR motif-containing protein Cup1-like N-terminal domain-containing protein n=1 Tax=Cryoendolithus antarcticus TaxID=1507870 RepID=A0A1V8SBU7_9PEZI|nr:hypothetical protein B0A48_17533 [Cryoendolithus antarcticus]